MRNGISEMLAVADRSTAWNRLSQGKLLALLATGLLAVPMAALSAPIVLDFEDVSVDGLPTVVGNFYAADGVTFSSNGFAVVHDSETNGTGIWNQVLPSGNASDAALYSFDGQTINLYSVDGFNSFSLRYTTLGPSFVSVYATGSSSPFAIFNLVELSDPFGETWTTFSSGAPWIQTATRLELGGGGIAGTVAFDDITLNPAPVPLPAAAWLLLSGLAGLGFVGRRRTAK